MCHSGAAQLCRCPVQRGQGVQGRLWAMREGPRGLGSLLPSTSLVAAARSPSARCGSPLPVEVSAPLPFAPLRSRGVPTVAALSGGAAVGRCAPPRSVPSRARLPQPRTAARGRPAPCGGSASPRTGREPAPCSRPPPSLPLSLPPRLPPPALPPPRLSPPLSAPQPPPGRPALPELCGRRGWQRGCGPWPCGCWR